jgi:putative ATPase
MVQCPICSNPVNQININKHIDSGCTKYLQSEPTASDSHQGSTSKSNATSSFFQTPSSKKNSNNTGKISTSNSQESVKVPSRTIGTPKPIPFSSDSNSTSKKRPSPEVEDLTVDDSASTAPPAKRTKKNTIRDAAPLAERMRPQTLDDVFGQELVGPLGVLRGLIESDRVPSMILWGGAGSGKTTIARVISKMVGSRFIEINSTSSGVADVKKIFGEVSGFGPNKHLREGYAADKVCI